MIKFDVAVCRYCGDKPGQSCKAYDCGYCGAKAGNVCTSRSGRTVYERHHHQQRWLRATLDPFIKELTA